MVYLRPVESVLRVRPGYTSADCLSKISFQFTRRTPGYDGSRAPRKICAAAERLRVRPPLPSATSILVLGFQRHHRVIRLARRTGIAGDRAPRSLQVTIVSSGPSKSPFRPAFVLVSHKWLLRSSPPHPMRIRLVPRYAVNWRLPEKIPIERPGNVTSRRAPSVFTVQPGCLER